MIQHSISMSTSGRHAARRQGTSGRCSIWLRLSSPSRCPGPGRCGRPRSSPGWPAAAPGCSARTGLLRWFARHQRVVQTFVTNLHGPEDPLTFSSAAVRAIIPIPSTTGNVTVTFAVASYAGTLRITILSDPSRMPDAPALAAALRHELSAPLIAALP
jgi:hypothetical protein